ncbi:hypothetical protein J45TS6_38040 [Paenibacillus sp. J45TS6]|uniref:cupin domain-containing protein n=1 Tax=unclassified Paenibacillus TaxID=185978 RepID=UPI001B0EA99A|nr:cupin domain-containing protein [Paenibacillus sp. J45TS6]GIP45345.1 hypothetical protein J45TS6_38040 [Paenibacillus sp. J45TS6]
MAVSYMDFTSPGVQYFYDLRNNRSFTKDRGNYINALGVKQLNTLGDNSLLDIYLTRGNIVEPHIHQNASELVYCISGAAVISIINPFTKEVIQVPVSPGQVGNVPQGWFHWEMATEDNTHLLAIFDAPTPEFIAVSDFLRLAPPEAVAHTYCLDEATYKAAIAPISDTVVIGPPANCTKYHQPQPKPQLYAQSNGTVYPNYGQRQGNYPQQGNTPIPHGYTNHGPNYGGPSPYRHPQGNKDGI